MLSEKVEQIGDVAADELLRLHRELPEDASWSQRLRLVGSMNKLIELRVRAAQRLPSGGGEESESSEPESAAG